MALSKSIEDRVKTLLDDNKPEEARQLLILEAGLSETEAAAYIQQDAGTTSEPLAANAPEGKRSYPMLIMGVFLIGLAIYFAYTTSQTIANSAMTTGVVIQLVESSDGDSYAPVIQYRYENQDYSFQSGTYSSPPAYEEGEEVQLYVNKNDPADVLMDSFFDKWFFPTFLGFLGLIFALVGYFVKFKKGAGGDSDIDFFDDDDD